MARGKLMWFTGLVLVLLFVGGIVGTYHFWPSNEDQRSAAFFSVLQFIAVFALVWLTFLYVTATQQLVETTQQQLSDQNRPPKISVIQYHFPQADPFSVNFEIEIANPSVRATSLRIRSIQIGEVFAHDVYFEVDQSRKARITVPARDLANVIVKAGNFDCRVPIALGSKTRTLLTFDEIFHGTLPFVITEV
jgi:hypothetical protein